MNQGILKSIVRGLESLTTDTGKAAIGQIGSRHAYATSVEHASKAVKDIADTHTIHSFRNSLELLKSVPNLRSYPGEVAVVPSKLSSALSAVHERLINTEQLAGLGPVQLRLLEGVQREFEFAIAAKRLERAGSQIFEQKFGANSLASHRPTSKIAEETVVRTDGSKIMAKTDGAFTQFAETAPRGELRLYSLSSGFHSGFIGDRLAFRRLGIGNGASSGGHGAEF